MSPDRANTSSRSAQIKRVLVGLFIANLAAVAPSRSWATQSTPPSTQ